MIYPFLVCTVTTLYQTIAEVGHTSRSTSPVPPPTASTTSSLPRGSTTNEQEMTGAGEGGRESQVVSPSSGTNNEIVADPNATYAAVRMAHAHECTVYETYTIMYDIVL